MTAPELCHNFFKNTSLKMHQTRLGSLMAAVQSMLSGSPLTVTGLGRNMPGSTKVKHKIKRSDRLLNNGFIAADKADIYKATREALIGSPKKLMLLADWSPFKKRRDYGIFRISCAFDGRSITLYEEVHVYSHVMQITHQERILKIAKELLPKNCSVVIVTDMGFMSPWFKAVKKLGWDFIGRVKGDIYHRMKEGENWAEIKSLDIKATITAKKYKNMHLFKTQTMKGNLILKRKNKKEYKKELSKNPTVKQYQVAAKKPWVLFTSLNDSAEKIAKIYAARMQIETGFRDCKSIRFGMGLAQSLQKTPCLIRRTVLLLVAHIVHCILLLVGWLGQNRGWQYDFQSSSTKQKRILSLVFLGRQILKHYGPQITRQQLAIAARSLQGKIENLARLYKIWGDS